MLRSAALFKNDALERVTYRPRFGTASIRRPIPSVRQFLSFSRNTQSATIAF
jgi:hypothetical protein